MSHLECQNLCISIFKDSYELVFRVDLVYFQIKVLKRGLEIHCKKGLKMYLKTDQKLGHHENLCINE